MKNVTITVDEQVAQWARVWAATHGTSVSRMVGELLRERMLAEQGYERSMRSYLSQGPVKLRKRRGRYPNRNSLHER